MRRIAALFVTVGCLSALAVGAAETRGISVKLRASEASDAPVVEEVDLYSKSHALVIGIDEYQKQAWPRLSQAVADAKKIASALETRGFDVTLALNLKSDALGAALKNFFIKKGRDPDARLFVWYAGHGHTQDQEGYLIPADGAGPSDEVGFLTTALSLRDFGKFVRYAKSKHVFTVFDSCFSGTIFNVARSAPPPQITRVTTKPTRQFLTSGDAGQTVSDDGTFAALFIEAINGERRADSNDDGFLTASELGAFLDHKMSNYSKNKQTPRYGKLSDRRYDKGDFVFSLERDAPRPVRAGGGQAADKETVFWQSIQNSNQAADFDDFIRQFPNGTFAGLARRRKAALSGPTTAALTPSKIEIEELDGSYVAVKSANVRAGPTSKSAKVGQLAANASVTVTGKVKGARWLRITLEDEAAYVFAPLLKEAGASQLASVPPSKAIDRTPKRRPDARIAVLDAAYIALKATDIREGPTENSKTLRQLAVGDGVAVTGKVKGTNWLRVAYADKSGFTLAAPLKEIDAQELVAWRIIEKSEKVADFFWFVAAYPKGYFLTQASKRIKEILGARGTALWRDIVIAAGGPALLLFNQERGNLKEFTSAYEWKSKYPTDYSKTTIGLAKVLKLNLLLSSTGKTTLQYKHFKHGIRSLAVPKARADETPDQRTERYLTVLIKVMRDIFKEDHVVEADIRPGVAEALAKHPEPNFLNDPARSAPVEAVPKLSKTVISTLLKYPPRMTFKDCEACPEMVVIPPGNFKMGNGKRHALPVHDVSINYAFAIGKYEIMIEEWNTLMDLPLPSSAALGLHPIEKVRWTDAKAFVKRLSERTGKPYRLLSEAEWEYASRAGTTTEYMTGKTITDKQARFNSFYKSYDEALRRSTTTKVGQFPPNAFGVYDMHGNVSEWVEDCLQGSYDRAPNNGSAWTRRGNCSEHALRGGSFASERYYIGSASRSFYSADSEPHLGTGLRVARDMATVMGKSVDADRRNGAELEQALSRLISDNKEFPVYYAEREAEPGLGAQRALGKIAGWLKSDPKVKIQIAGHVDRDELAGKGPHYEFGERRAIEAFIDLMSKGIDRDRISIMTYGSTQPVAAADGKFSRSKSRRILIRKSN